MMECILSVVPQLYVLLQCQHVPGEHKQPGPGNVPGLCAGPPGRWEFRRAASAAGHLGAAGDTETPATVGRSADGTVRDPRRGIPARSTGRRVRN